MAIFVRCKDLRLEGQCVPPISDKVQVCIHKNMTVWIVNTSEETVECNSGELFGVNVGEFVEKAIGQLQLASQSFFLSRSREGNAGRLLAFPL